MRFVWFWTFWHWSKEGRRSGALLRGPLDGIGGHWDEWFSHEASEEDRRAIQEAGRTESSQRRFVAWLRRHWAREVGYAENRLVLRYLLRQLALLPPFDAWSQLETHRRAYGARGVSAIVLGEDSPGEPDDVRTIEAVALPVDSDGDAPSIAPEGFRAEEGELDTVRAAAANMLEGKGLLALLVRWMLMGRRPYPRIVSAGLGAAWLGVGGLAAYLIAGPDPGERLVPLVAGLAAAWSCLVIVACAAAGKVCLEARREGRRLRSRLESSRIEVRMESGLTLRGGSAGLAFCLNVLGSLHRAHPPGARPSWLWQRFFRTMRSGAPSWAATGVVTADSRVRPVVVAPKLRACLLHPRVERLLTPRQRGAGRRAIERLIESLAPAVRQGGAPRAVARQAGAPPADALPADARPAARARERLGFAAETGPLKTRACSHVAQAILSIAGLPSRGQLVGNVAAAALSIGMLLAVPDMRGILLPPAAPAVVAPGSPSPYFLWVSLDTESPGRFLVVLESEFWANRRAEVGWRDGARSAPRAEIRLHRLARPARDDGESGTIWIERRRKFLTREFAPGERVGRYSLAYLSHLPPE